MDDLVVFCADVGSVKNGKFGWARSPAAIEHVEEHDTSRPLALVEAVAAELRASRPVALGFECPLFVPVPTDDMALGGARGGEGNRPWSAGAGTGALATGLVQAAWTLSEIRVRAPGARLHLDWTAFADQGGDLLVWEAFVTAKAKGTSHVDDATIAVSSFLDALPDPESDVSAERPFSLAGAVALWSGWASHIELVHAVPLVIRS